MDETSASTRGHGLATTVLVIAAITSVATMISVRDLVASSSPGETVDHHTLRVTAQHCGRVEVASATRVGGPFLLVAAELVNGADVISIDDGTRHVADARVVAIDDATGALALLAIDHHVARPATASLDAGSVVVVSAFAPSDRREVEAHVEASAPGEWVLDAALDESNRGAAVFDDAGRLVGIVTTAGDRPTIAEIVGLDRLLVGRGDEPATVCSDPEPNSAQ